MGSDSSSRKNSFLSIERSLPIEARSLRRTFTDEPSTTPDLTKSK